MKSIKIPLTLLLLVFVSSLHAQDWPDLKHYQAANQTLKKSDKTTVIFIGDSITEGWITESPDFFSGNGYVDRGIAGQTSPQMLLRFQQDVISLKPNAVVLLCGINDLAGNTGPTTVEMIEDNIKSMAEIATTNGVKMILCSVMPSNYIYWKPELKPMDNIDVLNTWIGNYARSKHLPYIDYYSSLVDDQRGFKAEYTKDRVHANLKGYKIMEALLSPAISSVLK